MTVAFGALIGSVSGGWAMLGFGSHGLPVSLALVYCRSAYTPLRVRLMREFVLEHFGSGEGG